LDPLFKGLFSLYGSRAAALYHRIEALVELYKRPLQEHPRWSEATAILICYGNIIQRQGEVPLQTLRRFLEGHVQGALDTIHVLPFAPSSSDEGFSVIDYRKLCPSLGSWEDLEALCSSFDLMADLVLNHCSSESAWFQQFLRDEEPGRGYFISIDPSLDLSQVMRPRSSSLLSPYETVQGLKHLWTTFSADQVDLNFSNPDLLLELLDILLSLLQRARLIRLDAVAYLWKQIGTSCIHLPETHEVVKLMRAVMERARPDALLITETNVPHEENISYLGAGDEAHMVYQFSLPPLLLHALHSGEASRLSTWAAALPELPERCAWLNFSASHDGVGLRPLEGLISLEERDALLGAMEARGGLISYKRNCDGTESPYELNISYFDAFSEGQGAPVSPRQIAAFLASQTVVMSLQGIPAVWFHSLCGSRNDLGGVKRQGYHRAINRHRWDEAELESWLSEGPGAAVSSEYLRRLRIRALQPAFHPKATQKILERDRGVFALERQGEGQRLLALHNLSSEPKELKLEGGWRDLLSDVEREGSWSLEPYACAWLRGVP